MRHVGAGGCGLRGEPQSASSARLHDATGPHFDEYGGQDSISLPGPHTQGTALPQQDRSTWTCELSAVICGTKKFDVIVHAKRHG